MTYHKTLLESEKFPYAELCPNNIQHLSTLSPHCCVVPV